MTTSVKFCHELTWFDHSSLLMQAAAADGSEQQRPKNLIRELVCAAIHSRAAYGHAMAVGHLDSIYNFALLQTVAFIFIVESAPAQGPDIALKNVSHPIGIWTILL